MTFFSENVANFAYLLGAALTKPDHGGRKKHDRHYAAEIYITMYCKDCLLVVPASWHQLLNNDQDVDDSPRTFAGRSTR